jgi:hypothetical protein
VDDREGMFSSIKKGKNEMGGTYGGVVNKLRESLNRSIEGKGIIDGEGN